MNLLLERNAKNPPERQIFRVFSRFNMSFSRLKDRRSVVNQIRPLCRKDMDGRSIGDQIYLRKLNPDFVNAINDFSCLLARRFFLLLDVLRKQGWIHADLFCQKLRVQHPVVLEKLLKVYFKLDVFG